MGIFAGSQPCHDRCNCYGLCLPQNCSDNGAEERNVVEYCFNDEVHVSVKLLALFANFLSLNRTVY